METLSCSNATVRARVERDGCSSAMSSCAILYAFLGKRCTADNIETQGPEEVGTDVSVPSESGAEQSGADFLVSQTKGGCSKSIICNQRREAGERRESSPVVKSCASEKSKSFCKKIKSKKTTKAKPGALPPDEFSLVEAGGKLKARIGSNIVPSRVAAVEGPNFQKAFTQAQSNTTVPDSAPELHSCGKCLFDELNGERRAAGSSRKNSKESRKRQNLTLAMHTAGNVSLIASEAAELSSAAGEKSLRKTRKAVGMDQACEEDSLALREKLNDGERPGDDVDSKNNIHYLEKGIEASLEKIVDEAKIRASEPRKGRLRSSTINFGTVAATDSQSIPQVKEKKGGLVKDKSRVASPKIGRTQNKKAGNVRRSTRNMQLAESEEDIPASSKENFSRKDKQQEHDARAQMEKSTVLELEMEPDEGASTTVNDFFVPASKKGKAKKKLEMTAVIAINHQEVRKRPSEGTHAQAMKDLASINFKQSLKDEEFFKPASKKHKQIASKVAKIQNPDVAVKSGTSASAGNGVGNSDFCFDLRMEAKLAAEENSQLCAGKPTHPFFVHNKAGHRSLDSSGMAIEGSLSHQASSFAEAEELIPSVPFHVTQISKMEECEAVWQGWNFAEIAGTEKAERSCLKEGSSGSHPKELCSLLRLHAPDAPSKTFREERLCGTLIENAFEPLINILKEHEIKGYVAERLALSDEEPLLFRPSLDHRGSTFEPSAPASSGLHDCSIAQNSLWTEVHQPRFPDEVCGNKETVKSLNAWLQTWQSKCRTWMGSLEGEKSERNTNSAENCDEDLGWFQEDSDSDGISGEEDALQNVLLLAGPVGCGKTAAIYACARDQGYTIIEVNSSDNRSGALIKQKFGEAMESHHLAKWSGDTSVPSTAPCCTKEKVSAEKIGGAKVACIDKNVKPASVAKKRGALAATENKRPKQGSPTCLHSETEEVSFQATLESENHPPVESESKTMTVMVFEDVDVVLEEDRGFMAALTQLAETTKRPIILTSNDQELVLPHALGTHFLGFKRPSTMELMALACKVCVAEGIPCSPEFLERLVKVCHHDIRKLLNFLQFWCQGHSRARLPKAAYDSKVLKDEEETGMHSKFELQEIDNTAGTWLYDLEAQHRLWPVLIPLGFPCSAGELIACKLSATILETEQRLSSAEERKIELEDAQNAILLSKIKKQHKHTPPAKVMDEDTDEREEIDTEETSFSQPCLSTDADESLLTPVKRLKEAKTMARSPILRKRIRRSLAIIMSDSDDDAQYAPQVEKQHQGQVYTDTSNLSERCLKDGTPISSLNTDAAMKTDLCATGGLAELEYRNTLSSEEIDANSFKSSMTGGVRDTNINCQVLESYASMQEANSVLLMKEKDRMCLTVETSTLPCQVALCGQEASPDLSINDAGETSNEVHKVDLSKENTCVRGHLTQICAASENASFELRVGNGCSRASKYTPQRACLGIPPKREGNMELLHVCLEVKDALNSVKVPPENILNCSDKFQNDVFCVPHAQVLPTPKALIQIPLLNSMNTEAGSLSGNTLSEHPLQNTACSHDISASKNTSLREGKLCKPVGLEVWGAEIPVDSGSLQLKINESLGGVQKSSYAEQSQASHCSGPLASLIAIDSRTEVMVCNDSGQMDALIPSANSNPLNNVTGHHGSVSNYANEKSSDCCDEFTNYCLQSTPEEGNGKNFFTEACLDSNACLPSVKVCVNKVGETLGCLTGSIKNSSSGVHVELLQSSNISIGGLTNSVKSEARGVECLQLSSNSETPQLEGTCHCSFLGDPREKDAEDNGHVENDSVQSVSEAVRSLWSHLRNSREEYGLVPNTASQNSLKAVVSLSNLADTLSACDIITSIRGSKAFEEMAGISAHVQKPNSRGLLRTCGQIAHIALQLCLQQCYPLTKLIEETRICTSPEHMMLALNHPCTLGKLAVCERWLQSADDVHSKVGPSSFEQDFKRLERKFAVQNALSNGLPARAQGTLLGSAFHEYASFVARIGHLEQARQSSGFSRRRCRGSQHYFSIHPWHLSEENINTLQEVCNFDRR